MSLTPPCTVPLPPPAVDTPRVGRAPARPALDSPAAGSPPRGALAATPPDLSTAVRWAQEGDEDAFRALYTDIQPRLLRYLRALVGTDAEDVASETWLQVARDLGSFQGDSAGFRGWVTAIGRHRATDHLRALRSRPRPAEVRAEDLERWAAPDSTEDRALASVATDAAIALLARLPREQAEAVLLHVVVGLDAPQAARLLGKRPGAVRTSCYRGLRRLGAMLDRAAPALVLFPVPVLPAALARVLRAAAAPGHASELARFGQAAAAFRAHLRPPGHSPGTPSSGPPDAPSMPALAQVLSTKAAVVTVAALAAGGLAVTAAVTTLTGAGSASGGRAHPHHAAAAHAGAFAAGSAQVRGSAPADAGHVARACEALVADAHAALAGQASTGGAGLTAAETERTLTSPVARTVLVRPVFRPLVTSAGGAAEVPALCSLVLRLPVLPTAQALTGLPTTVLSVLPTPVLSELPASVLARLPVSALVHLPASVLAGLPVPVLARLPASVLRTLPASALARLPASVLHTLPASVLRTLPPSVLRTLPASVSRWLPGSGLSAPGATPGMPPGAGVGRPAESVHAHLPPPVFRAIPPPVRGHLPVPVGTGHHGRPGHLPWPAPLVRGRAADPVAHAVRTARKAVQVMPGLPGPLTSRPPGRAAWSRG